RHACSPSMGRRWSVAEPRWKRPSYPPLPALSRKGRGSGLCKPAAWVADQVGARVAHMTISRQAWRLNAAQVAGVEQSPLSPSPLAGEGRGEGYDSTNGPTKNTAFPRRRKRCPEASGG